MSQRKVKEFDLKISIAINYCITVNNHIYHVHIKIKNIPGKELYSNEQAV
jgi:hypothetical protein